MQAGSGPLSLFTPFALLPVRSALLLWKPLRVLRSVSGGDFSKIIRAATVRFVHMLAILFFSSTERSLRGTVDIPGIGRPSIAATWYTACRVK